VSDRRDVEHLEGSYLPDFRLTPFTINTEGSQQQGEQLPLDPWAQIESTQGDKDAKTEERR
jgi:hypothetical protein